MTEKNSRKPAYAGSFYPRESGELSRVVKMYIDDAKLPNVSGVPRILICPHAGYIYSGPVAGATYKLLQKAIIEGKVPKRVFLLGPSHHTSFSGVCISDTNTWEMPMGDVEVDGDVRMQLEKDEHCVVSDEAHAIEHSLEVQLPFLQYVYGEKPFYIIPILISDIAPAIVTKMLIPFINDDSLLVVSSDLSHYLPYEKARSVDNKTISDICSLNDTFLTESACGLDSIKVAISLAKRFSWKPVLLSYANSGDTAGDREAVVGYTAISFME